MEVRTFGTKIVHVQTILLYRYRVAHSVPAHNNGFILFRSNHSNLRIMPTQASLPQSPKGSLIGSLFVLMFFALSRARTRAWGCLGSFLVQKLSVHFVRCKHLDKSNTTCGQHMSKMVSLQVEMPPTNTIPSSSNLLRVGPSSAAHLRYAADPADGLCSMPWTFTCARTQHKALHTPSPSSCASPLWALWVAWVMIAHNSK